MKRRATSVWKGPGMEGQGTLTTQSKAFNEQPYSTKMRFENEDGKQGTNPEELIAAAHAGCFNMALSFALGGEGYTPDELRTEAVVSVEKEEGSNDYTITKSVLKLSAQVPDISKEAFEKIAQGAKKNCPVSKVLNCPIELEVELK